MVMRPITRHSSLENLLCKMPVAVCNEFLNAASVIEVGAHCMLFFVGSVHKLEVSKGNYADARSEVQFAMTGIAALEQPTTLWHLASPTLTLTLTLTLTRTLTKYVVKEGTKGTMPHAKTNNEPPRTL